MTIRVLYFALIRERLRKSSDELSLPPGSTAADLLAHLSARYEPLRGQMGAVRLAVNEAFVAPDHPLAEGDEVAVIPPVSGGGPYCRLSAEPLALSEVIAAVSGPDLPDQGGVVTFCGVVRRKSRGKQVLRLEYEAYDAMALRALGALIQSLEAAAPGVRLAIVHRTGVLAVGEAAVVIAASAAHRAEAFAACRDAIDRLKQEVPIWKKEVAEDGEEWIGARP